MSDGVKRNTPERVRYLDSQLAVKHRSSERRLAERAAKVLTKRESRTVSVSEVFRRGMVQFATAILQD